jgi:hypothetical protein
MEFHCRPKCQNFITGHKAAPAIAAATGSYTLQINFGRKLEEKSPPNQKPSKATPLYQLFHKAAPW